MIDTTTIDYAAAGSLGSLTLWRGKVDDVAVALEHIDLLNRLDGLRVQLLQRRLELLVIVGVSCDVALLLVSRRSLST